MERGIKRWKLKFFPVIFDLTSDELFGDVYTLIDFRKSVK